MPARKKRAKAQADGRAKDGPLRKRMSQGKKPPAKVDMKRRLLKAMGHVTRAKIFAMMNDREWSPNEVSNELAVDLNQVSYHVKVLKDFELIELTKTEPRRGAVEHYYRATERAIVDLALAKDMPPSGLQGLISETHSQINADVNDSIKAGTYNSRPDQHTDLIPVVLDDMAFAKSHELGDEFIDIMLDLAAESAKRLAASDNPQPVVTTGVLLIFPSSRSEHKPVEEKRRKRKKSA